MLWLRVMNEDEDMYKDKEKNEDDDAKWVIWQLARQALGLRGVGDYSWCRSVPSGPMVGGANREGPESRVP